MTRLERNAKMIEILWTLGGAYENGDFSQFIKFLSEDCVYESMWMQNFIQGKNAVSRHLLSKEKSIRDSETYPVCGVVELVGNMNPIPSTVVLVNGAEQCDKLALAYEPGKYCMMVAHELDGNTNGVLFKLELNEEGFVSRIDLCLPELFETRALNPYINIFPSNIGENDGSADSDDDDELSAMVYVGEAYFSELYTFFHVVGETFDEYENLVIPMEQWKMVLSIWDEFVKADDYDHIVEKLCGIDYTTWSVANRKAHNQLNWCGKKIWNDRKINSVMLHDLKEWTEKYQDKYGFIRTYGC